MSGIATLIKSIGRKQAPHRLFALRSSTQERTAYVPH
jgi:hypothetical protein